MRRRLAAVLAADVAGYSRLMGADEAGTLAALRRLREEVFAPAVAARHGRLVKSMGDGWLVLFDSTVEAVGCAIHVQDQMARGPAPGEPEIRLRIGVHIGDVTHEGEDIFGDCVNVAARLEGFAEPGAVAISDSAHGNLDGLLRPGFDAQGEHELKNIDRPVRIWTRAPRVLAPADTGGWPQLSIAPIRAPDDRTQVREIADALTGDLVQALDGPHWLSATVSAEGREGAFRLAAQLRASGDRLRLETRLTAPDGAPLWAQKYDGDLSDPFDWQDDTAADAVARCLGAVLDLKRRELNVRPIEGLTSRDCELLALMALDDIGGRSHADSMRFAAAAIEKDPGAASAYGAMLTVFSTGVALGFWTAEDYPQLPSWIHSARKLRDRDPQLDFALAHVDYARDREPNALRAAAARALRHPSQDFVRLAYVAWAYIWLGEPEPALACCERGLRIGRFSANSTPLRGAAATACVEAGRYQAALAHVKEGLLLSQSYTTFYRAAAAALAQLGRVEEAREEVAKTLALLPADSIANSRERSGYQDNAATRLLFDGLRLAGMPE